MLTCFLSNTDMLCCLDRVHKSKWITSQLHLIILEQWRMALHCLFISSFVFSVCAEVENAKWGLQGGQAYNISTIHSKWNPFSHPLCHPQCHPLCESPHITRC